MGTTMKITDLRRENLRALIEKQGAGKLADKLGYKHPSFLSQMAGPNPTRDITEKTARAYEEKLGLQSGYFDMEHEGVISAPAAARVTVDLGTGEIVAEVIRLVGSICAGEEVSLPPVKFADVVALAYLDTVEHNNAPRPDHIKQLVRLLK